MRALNHIALVVRDPERSLQFYRDVLGLNGTIHEDAYGIVMLTNGLLLTFLRDTSPGAADGFHIGFSLSSSSEVRDLREQLRDRGVREAEWWDEPDFVSIKMLDPDGYRVEAFWDAEHSIPPCGAAEDAAMSAADNYANRVDAVLAQRTRLRGPEPVGDIFGGLPPDSHLFTSDPRRELEPNLANIASYVASDDVIVDVGGGAGRLSLPLALRCRGLINIDPSPAMLAGFEANVRAAGITNSHTTQGTWPDVEAPPGTFALVNHVTYLTRDIVTFIRRLEASGSRRVLITVNHPPPPSWNRKLFATVFGEEEEIVPGHMELVQVLWEIGIQPDIRLQPEPTAQYPAAPTRDAAIEAAIARFSSDQWAIWPLGEQLERRVRSILENQFHDLFAETPNGYVQSWLTYGREVIVTWEPRR